MKKTTFLLLLAFMLSIWHVKSQVMIGSGTIETANTPFEPFYGYTYSQSIYLADEINASGEITGLQWYYSGTSDLADNQELVIYMAESTTSSFPSTADWEPFANFTQVYSGGITVEAGVNGWVQIVFDTPFTYSGTDNLIIAVDENMPSYDSSGDDFYNTDMGTSRSIVYYNDGTNPDPASPPSDWSTSTSTLVPNIILDGITQACPNPSDLAVNSTGLDSAELAWTENGDATSWNIELVEAGTTPTGTGNYTADANPFTATGLTSGTSYEYYVQADCGAEQSGWIGPFSFDTQLCDVTEQCEYTFVMTDSFGDGWNGNTMTISQNGVDVETITLSSGSSGEAQVTLCDGQPFELFWNTGGSWAGEVGVVIQAFGEDLFTMPSGSGSLQGTTIYSGTVNCTPPSCAIPTDLNADNITAYTAELSWTDNNTGVSSWNVEVVESGTTPTGVATDVADTNTAFEVSGLSAITEYAYYVQANCGDEDGLSNWAGPFFFTTECAVFIPPYLQEFNSFIPDCWAEADNGDPTSGPTDFIDTWTWAEGGFANVGWAGAYRINLYGTGKSDWVISPEFNLDGGPWQLEWDFAIMQGFGTDTAGILGSDDQVQLLITTDGGTTWTPIEEWDNTSTVPVGGDHFIYSLEAYTGVVQFAVWASEGEVADFADASVSFDNFEIVEIPACPQPTSLTVELVDMTTAILEWTEYGTATSWNIEIVNVDLGETPDGTPDYTGVTNPYTVMDLDPDTNYEYYVQADCGADDGTSTWSGPRDFYTGYCISVPTSNDGQGVTNVQIETSNYPSFGDVTYEDHTDGTVQNLFQGWETTVIVSFATGFTYNTNIWIDLNDDLVFDNDTELFFQGESEWANPTTLECVFTLPVDANPGLHRMRIGTADFGQTNPNPCFNGSFGVTLDFTVNIVEPTCELQEATFALVDDCANGDQFLIDVTLVSMGDATSITIGSDFDDATVEATEAGTYQIGPFPFDTTVIAYAINTNDSNCLINSTPFLQLACPPDNDNCDAAIEAGVNETFVCDIVTPGVMTGSTPSGAPAGCAGANDDDVWFFFEATDPNLIVSINNIVGDETNLDMALYSGTCGDFTELACTTTTSAIVNDLVIGETYYVRVFTTNQGVYESTFDLCIRPIPGPVQTDTTTYTYEELVTDVLIDSPCADVSNITYSGQEGIGYFYTETPGFAFEDGIVLVSGNADSPNLTGPNGAGPSLQNSGGQDQDLFDYIQATGIDPSLFSYNDSAVLEFDFVPYVDEFSFNFLFASEEYGTFQCSFSDAFAFFLTNTETGITENLAVVPGTGDPISVLTIRDQAYNAGCGSVNAEYFDSYFGAGGVDPLAAPINFNGMTIPMAATSTVEIGVTYHIKLVVADRNDSILDSAVFIQGGSLSLGEIDLGVDITIADGTALCQGEPVVLDTGLEGAYHTWYQDFVEISGENTSVLTVTEPGNYYVQVGESAQCSVADDINVEFLPLPEFVTEAVPLEECSGEDFTEFDLTQNAESILDGTQDPSEFTFAYYTTEQDAMDQTNPILDPTAYVNVSSPQTIYVGAVNTTTGCYDSTSFEISINALPEPVQPDDMFSCADMDGYATFDLETQTDVITGGQTGYLVTYHESMADADGAMNALTSPFETMPPQTIYVRVEDEMTGCYSTTTFVVDQYPFEDASFSYDEEFIMCSETGMALTATAGGNFAIVEPANTTAVINPDTGMITGAGSGATYVVSYTTTGPCPQTTTVTVEMDTCIFPEVVTPNGDGSNDSFDLTGFGVNSLEIFNRYGTKVFSFTGAYTDEFRGVSDDGDELPTGTYFYVVKYKDTEVRTDWFYITREQ
ncbi:choice-of-anchor L domain-containing protein [Mangrovimonas futianensis]|uniref:choice-of-anchor L domain-containing protein n=1 Tax=Mangrovimonas futianensis TaxID=2895523 RepID=UPI001E30DE1A|nr:choice-of-anchor L domain-containing protein [Mangrovimonas futianensis]MCF1420609.1 choice-of-anchor L domain-containing protein [Mangrovimonas futianensis]